MLCITAGAGGNAGPGFFIYNQGDRTEVLLK